MAPASSRLRGCVAALGAAALLSIGALALQLHRPASWVGGGWSTAEAQPVPHQDQGQPRGCEAPSRAAVLLVGDYDNASSAAELEAAAAAIRDALVRPYGAEVFAVTGSGPRGERLHGALRRAFGARLRAWRRIPAAGCDAGEGGGGGVELCAAPAKYSGTPKPGRFLQWHKLQAAWSLMAAFEQAHHTQFSLVVKLRPDAVPVAGLPSAPWRICAERDGLEAPVLHAASDFAFWGGRRAMAAAVSVYPGALSAPTQQREDEAAPLFPIRPLADLLTCPVSAVGSDGRLLRAAPSRAARPSGVGGAAAALRAQRPTPELGAARLGAVHQARHAALPGCARRRCVPTPDNTQSSRTTTSNNHAIDT